MRKYQSSIYLSFVGLALLIGSSSINPAARLIRDEAIAGSHATTNELLSSLSFSLRREEDELGRRRKRKSIRRILKTLSGTAPTDTNTKATKEEKALTDDDFTSPLSTSPKKWRSNNSVASSSSSATITHKDPVSIASRTTSIELSIKSTLSPKERDIHFVEPQTAFSSAMPTAKDVTTNSSSSLGSGSSNNSSTNMSTLSSSTAPSAKTTTTKAVSTTNSTSTNSSSSSSSSSCSSSSSSSSTTSIDTPTGKSYCFI